MADPLVVVENTPAPRRNGEGNAVRKLVVVEKGPASRGASYHGDPLQTAGSQVHVALDGLVVTQRDGGEAPAVYAEAWRTPSSGTTEPHDFIDGHVGRAIAGLVLKKAPAFSIYPPLRHLRDSGHRITLYRCLDAELPPPGPRLETGRRDTPRRPPSGAAHQCSRGQW